MVYPNPIDIKVKKDIKHKKSKYLSIIAILLNNFRSHPVWSANELHIDVQSNKYHQNHNINHSDYHPYFQVEVL